MCLSMVPSIFPLGLLAQPMLPYLSVTVLNKIRKYILMLLDILLCTIIYPLILIRTTVSGKKVRMLLVRKIIFMMSKQVICTRTTNWSAIAVYKSLIILISFFKPKVYKPLKKVQFCRRNSIIQHLILKTIIL